MQQNVDFNDVEYAVKPNTQNLEKNRGIEIIEAALPVHSVIQGSSGAVLFPGLLPQAQGKLTV